MPGLRFIFGCIALLLGFYGLLSVQWSQGPSQSRYDQPPQVRELIARAYSDPQPADQHEIAQLLERELVASLHEPGYFNQ